MIEYIFNEWGFIAYPMVMLFALVGMIYLDRRTAKQRVLTDEDYIAIMARQSESSEYNIFHIAAKDWNVSKEKVEQDFRDYLLRSQLPYYIRDFVRRNKEDVRNRRFA